MPRVRRLLPLILVATVAGCGSGGGSHRDRSADGATSSVEEGFTARRADGAVHIGMKRYDYAPVMATVKQGQRIVWTNTGTITHDVKAIRGGSFASKTLHKGDTFSTTLHRPGLVDYECTLHPGMLGTIVVEPSR